jgi:hypothetical protein
MKLKPIFGFIAYMAGLYMIDKYGGSELFWGFVFWQAGVLLMEES